MSPWLSNSAVTLDLLQEAGYHYVMDWTSDDQPIWLTTRQGRLLSMPYPIECNDTRGIVWYGYTFGEFAEMLVDNFDEMLAQSVHQPLVCPIAFIPLWWGGPIAFANYDGPLSTSCARDRIWLTRPRDICAYCSLPPDGPGELMPCPVAA